LQLTAVNSQAIKVGISGIIPSASRGVDFGEGNWGDLLPKTYKNNFIHHDFVQFKKQDLLAAVL